MNEIAFVQLSLFYNYLSHQTEAFLSRTAPCESFIRCSNTTWLQFEVRRHQSYSLIKRKEKKKKANFPSGTVKQKRERKREEWAQQKGSRRLDAQDDLRLYDGSKSSKSLLPIINPAALIRSKRVGTGQRRGGAAPATSCSVMGRQRPGAVITTGSRSGTSEPEAQLRRAKST